MLKRFSVVVMFLVAFTGLHTPVFADNHGEPPVKELEQQFNDLIYLETTEDGEVKKYDSMARLQEEMKSIMVWPLADHYLDTYFKERDGKLYLQAMDGPVQLKMDQDYTLEKVSTDKYKLTQHGENPLRGEYTLTITYSYEAGKWVFGDRMNHVTSSENGGELPDTATSLPIIMVSGVAVMALGALLLTFRRKTTV